MITRTIGRRALIDRLSGQLARAQLERPSRPGVTESGELEWVVFEREILLKLVNAERAKLGRGTVEMDAVMLIENSAVGHFDYTQKLAIRAAELVLGD